MGSHRPAVETPTLSDGWKKMQISLLTVLATLLVLASSAPQNRPSLTRDQPQGRNQVFNPCRNRGGTRNTNTKSTNNRIFGNSNIDNGILGFLGGFAAASVAQNAGLTSNCG